MATVVDLARDAQYQRRNNVGGTARYTTFPANSQADPQINTVRTTGSATIDGAWLDSDYNEIDSDYNANTPGAAEPSPVPPKLGAQG